MSRTKHRCGRFSPAAQFVPRPPARHKCPRRQHIGDINSGRHTVRDTNSGNGNGNCNRQLATQQNAFFVVFIGGQGTQQGTRQRFVRCVYRRPGNPTDKSGTRQVFLPHCLSAAREPNRETRNPTDMFSPCLPAAREPDRETGKPTEMCSPCLPAARKPDKEPGNPTTCFAVFTCGPGARQSTREPDRDVSVVFTNGPGT